MLKKMQKRRWSHKRDQRETKNTKTISVEPRRKPVPSETSKTMANFTCIVGGSVWEYFRARCLTDQPMDTYMKSYGNLSGGVTKIGLAKGVPHSVPSIPWSETSCSQVAHGNRLRPIPFPFLTHNKRIRHTSMALERKGFQTFPSQPALSCRTPCHGRDRIKFSTCHKSLTHRTRKATPKKRS